MVLYLVTEESKSSCQCFLAQRNERAFFAHKLLMPALASSFSLVDAKVGVGYSVTDAFISARTVAAAAVRGRGCSEGPAMDSEGVS